MCDYFHILLGIYLLVHLLAHIYDEDNSLILYMQTKVCAKGKFPHCWLRSLFLFPTFSWLSKSPVIWFKNSFCLHTWLPPGKYTTFSTSRDSFIHTEIPKYNVLLITALDWSRHLTSVSACMWAGCFSQWSYCTLLVPFGGKNNNIWWNIEL